MTLGSQINPPSINCHSTGSAERVDSAYWRELPGIMGIHAAPQYEYMGILSQPHFTVRHEYVRHSATMEWSNLFLLDRYILI